MEETTQPATETAPEEKKDMLDALLDLSFRTAITPKVIRWLYIIGIIVSGLLAAKWVIAAFTSREGGIMSGMVSLIFAPIIFLLYALITRVLLEIVQAIFSIAESLKRIEKQGKHPL